MSPNLSVEKSKRLHSGVVIPAHPLALDANRKLDERRQRALSRYYMDAGSGGLAIGVHTTQFEIRDPAVGLFEPVLSLGKEEIDLFEEKNGNPVLRIAGAIGPTIQATREAELAATLGYDAVLLSLAALPNATNDELIQHCRSVADILPVMGFYLQTTIGGRLLDLSFWREFAQIENVVAIKIAAFNRYHTIDVIRGIIESGRSQEIALYTGNDDTILVDLMSDYAFECDGTLINKRFAGGLLGHWAVWTKRAVELLETVKSGALNSGPAKMLSVAHKITDCNAAFFDAANDFAGCIPGLHEVLNRQGLLEGTWTLNPEEVLSPQQKQEIDRVYEAYPELNDDAFVAENLNRWLS